MIVGELKRHFRDKGWDVRVPRRLQELRLEITKATSDLSQQLGRSPTVSDIASHLGVTDEDVIEGLDSGHAYRALSLHAPVAGEEATTELADLLGDVDPDMQGVEDREGCRSPRHVRRRRPRRWKRRRRGSLCLPRTGRRPGHPRRL